MLFSITIDTTHPDARGDARTAIKTLADMFNIFDSAAPSCPDLVPASIPVPAAPDLPGPRPPVSTQSRALLPGTDTYVPVDVNGLPWDKRIHVGSQAFVADGSWRRKLKVSDEEFDRVRAELVKVMAAPAAGAIVAQVQADGCVASSTVHRFGRGLAGVEAGDYRGAPPPSPAPVAPTIVAAIAAGMQKHTGIVLPPDMRDELESRIGAGLALAQADAVPEGVEGDDGAWPNETPPPALTPAQAFANSQPFGPPVGTLEIRRDGEIIAHAPAPSPPPMDFNAFAAWVGAHAHHQRVKYSDVEEVLRNLGIVGAEGVGSFALLANRPDLIPAAHSALSALLTTSET